MAGQKPFFLTGANAILYVNNKKIAFATDVSYRVVVRHASPRILGHYEPEVHQPVSYDVNGSFTIIKYVQGLKDFLPDGSAPTNVSNEGDGVGSMGLGGALGQAAFGLPNAQGLVDGLTDQALIPAKLFQARTFDIEIRQKLPPTTIVDGTPLDSNAATLLGNAINIANALVGQSSSLQPNEAPVVRLRECRIEEFTFHVGRRGVAEQRVTFKARYADDDTFVARQSGP